jgi:hypothetical protein
MCEDRVRGAEFRVGKNAFSSWCAISVTSIALTQTVTLVLGSVVLRNPQSNSQVSGLLYAAEEVEYAPQTQKFASRFIGREIATRVVSSEVYGACFRVLFSLSKAANLLSNQTSPKNLFSCSRNAQWRE